MLVDFYVLPGILKTVASKADISIDQAISYISIPAQAVSVEKDDLIPMHQASQEMFKFIYLS